MGPSKQHSGLFCVILLQLICNGFGECNCGKCVCDPTSPYQGPKCEQCNVSNKNIKSKELDKVASKALLFSKSYRNGKGIILLTLSEITGENSTYDWNKLANKEVAAIFINIGVKLSCTHKKKREKSTIAILYWCCVYRLPSEGPLIKGNTRQERNRYNTRPVCNLVTAR